MPFLRILLIALTIHVGIMCIWFFTLQIFAINLRRRRKEQEQLCYLEIAPPSSVFLFKPSVVSTVSLNITKELQSYRMIFRRRLS